MRIKIKYFGLAILWLLFSAVTVLAQETPPLQLRLSRDFGYGAGDQVQGTFSFRVEGPDNLTRVVFLIDGEPIGEDTEAPFRLQFNTDTYAAGRHTLSAIGYTADGRELTSNEISRNFITRSESRRSSALILAVIGGLIVAGRLITAWITKRGRKPGEVAVSGPLGGAICPRCGRPFPLHFWGFRLLFTRLERCSHCGRWVFVNRAHPAALQAAAEAMRDEETDSPPTVDPEETLRRRLEDSRFDEQ